MTDAYTPREHDRAMDLILHDMDKPTQADIDRATLVYHKLASDAIERRQGARTPPLVRLGPGGDYTRDIN